MPGIKKKDLHLAHSVGDLNKMAGNLPEIKNVRLCVGSAQKLFRKAEDTMLLADEEMAYVLYMKYFNFISGIKKTVEYKKNEKYFKDLIGMKNLLKAMDEAEKLSDSLKNRYEEREAEIVSKKLESLNTKDSQPANEKETIDTEEKIPDKTENINKDAKKEGQTNNTSVKAGHMAVTQLYSLLHDVNTSLLIIDTRAEEEYVASHITHHCCISVPYKIVPPGCVVKKIEENLPAASKDLWDRRDLVDFIVLIDWLGNENSLIVGSTLQSLKDALYKWDRITIIKSEPLVLSGGFNDVLLYYPMLVTNAHVPRPKVTGTINAGIPSLDGIDYDLELNFLKSPEELASEVNKKNLTVENLSEKFKDSNLTPQVDRSIKPKPITMGVNSQRVDTPLNTDRTHNNRTKDFKKPDITFKLNDLRQELIKGEKDTNVKKQGNVEIPQPLPSVDRKLKPRSEESPDDSVESSRTGSTISLDSAGTPSPKHTEKTSEKPSELTDADIHQLRVDSQRLVLEHKARLAKLKKEQEAMSRLQELKANEVRETASLLRTKTQIQDEIKQLEMLLEEKERRMAAEDDKWVDEQMRKRKADEAAEEASTQDRSEVKQQPARQDDTAAERESMLKEQERRAKQEKEEAERRKQEQEVKLIKEEKEKEKKLFEQQQREEQLREQKRKEQMLQEQTVKGEQLKQQQLKEQQLKELKMKEEQEKKAREEKMRQEQEAKAKQERDRKEAEKLAAEARAKQETQSKLITPGLRVGWEKRLDASTGRYYYINHETKKTQWEPPQPATTKPKESYKTQLKDEPSTPSSGGMKRSHSSPNIAKLVSEDKPASPQISARPSVERTSKPKVNENRPVILQTEVSAAKVRNLQPLWGSVGRGLTGLKNLGNTCYMNSIIQCLSNTMPLTHYLLSGNFSLDINRENVFGKGGEVAEEFAVLVKALWSGQYKSVSPRDFKLTVAKFHELFAGYSQQDSQEFLLFLMDGLHEDLNRVVRRKTLPEQNNEGIPDKQAAETAWRLHKTVNESIIVELFQGQFKSTVRCLTCNKNSVTFDAFMYLTLPIPSSTRCSLKDCLRHFAKEEKMTGESRWLCPRCKCHRDAVKQIVIWKLPPVLLIHLKRFYYQGMWRQKITAYVDFPLDNLDMRQYSAGPSSPHDYKLYGLSNHYGSLDGGHYTAYCQNNTAKKWCKYDDHEVYNISSSDIQSSAAYILFYTSLDVGPLF